jgi:hypothetical protein
MSGQSQKLAKWSLILLAVVYSVVPSDLNQARAQQSSSEDASF